MKGALLMAGEHLREAFAVASSRRKDSMHALSISHAGKGETLRELNKADDLSEATPNVWQHAFIATVPAKNGARAGVFARQHRYCRQKNFG